jgi:hypothetical protein
MNRQPPRRHGSGAFRPRSSILRALLLALALMALALTAGCGGGSGGAADTTAPVGSLEVTGGTVLSAGTAIVIAFNESMDTGTLVLDGSLEPSAVASWADSSVPAALATPLAANDTLTLQPIAGTWPTGFDQTLTIDIKDAAGNAMPTLSLSMDIFEFVAFVHPEGDDATADGSSSLPYKTIQAAIGGSEASVIGTAVLVAAGEYSHDYRSDTTALVTMADLISLYGGYSATDWSERDPATHVTTLRDTSTTGGSYPAPNRAVTFPSTVNGDTYLDGFVVEGGGGVASAAIVVQNNANIRNNVIRGGAGGDSLGLRSVTAAGRSSRRTRLMEERDRAASALMPSTAISASPPTASAAALAPGCRRMPSTWAAPPLRTSRTTR